MMPKRGTKLIKIPLLILFLLVSCARLKQCAYEGLNRDQWQQPDRVVESLQIHPGDQVADIGSGSGYFVFSLAKSVGPDGKVYAVDVDKEMNDLVAERAKKSGIANVEVILAKTDDPSLPRTGVDLIFTSNTYHHIDNRVTYLTNLRKYLRPNGRLPLSISTGGHGLRGCGSTTRPANSSKERWTKPATACSTNSTFSIGNLS